MSDTYGAFLKARAELINAWWSQKTPDRIARDLSCDATQVELIHGACGPDGPFTTDSRPKNCPHEYRDGHCLKCGGTPSEAERRQLLKRIAELEALLNSAPVADFLESVRVEAAHQVERWKIEHDDGKAPTDWLWLLGYLATKATTSATLGDTKKALHHVVTSAAVLLNWHARLSGHDRGFRPGTGSDAQP